MNLKDASFDELLVLRQEVEKEIRDRKNQETAALAKVVQERASQLGVTAEEILGMLGKKPVSKKSMGVAKYANPANAAETWTGKGRKPVWFAAALESGKSADDMLIS